MSTEATPQPAPGELPSPAVMADRGVSPLDMMNEVYAAQPAALPNPALPQGFQPQPQPGRTPVPPSTAAPFTPAVPPRPDSPLATLGQQLANNPQQPAPAAPAAPAAAADSKSPIDWKGKKAAEWAALKSERDQMAARLAQLSGQPAPAPAPGQPAPAAPTASTPSSTQDWRTHPEAAALLKEHAALTEQIKLANAAEDPELKARYGTKQETLTKQIKFSAGGAAAKVEAVLSQPPSEARDVAFEEAIKDCNPSTQARLRAQMGQLASVEAEKQAEVAARAATWQQRQEQARNQDFLRQQERSRQLQDTFERVQRQWADPANGMPFTLNPQENPGARALVDKAQSIMFGKEIGDQDMAEIAFKAASFDALAAGAAALEQEHNALLARFEQMVGRSPQSRMGAPAPQLATQSPIPPTTFGTGNPFHGLGSFEEGLAAASINDRVTAPRSLY